MKLFIVDDHTLFRKSLIKLLSSTPSFEVVGEASTGMQALKTIPAINPDIVLMDISLPGMTGIETTLRLKAKYPHIKIIMLSGHTEEEYIQRSLINGASGYLSKNSDHDAFIEAIQEIMNETLEQEQYRRKEILDLAETEEKKTGLTIREIEVISSIAEGLTTKQIAERLFISPKTVNNHRNNIYNKLQIKNSVELVRYAIKSKIISL